MDDRAKFEEGLANLKAAAEVKRIPPLTSGSIWYKVPNSID
jgi:hypothetical protein